MVGGNHGAEKENMVTAVPYCVDKADKLVVGESADSGPAVPLQASPPRNELIVATESWPWSYLLAASLGLTWCASGCRRAGRERHYLT